MIPTKETAAKTKGRLLWIDWMKSIGIYFIVLGHFFPHATTDCIYTFSVPLFFLISGFLCKREDKSEVFRRKLWFNLAVPMFLISAIVFAIRIAFSVINGTFSITNLLLFPVMAITGFHSGVGCMWFVYTLIVLKLILQFAPRDRVTQMILFIGLPLSGIWIDHHPMVMGHNIVQMSNAIINATMAYPFFISGFYLRRWKTALSQSLSISIELLCLVACMAIVVLCAMINGGVWMYLNGYGNNIMLFMLGGYAGTAGVFIVSRWMQNLWPEIIVTISKGTIIILGFHLFFISAINKVIVPGTTILDYVSAALIVIAFIPIIRFCEKHLPYLIGKYRA